MANSSDDTDYEIYLITSEDYWYVGSTTIGVSARYKQHLAGRGNAQTLWEQIQRLGPECFSVEVVEAGYGQRVQAEREWYDRLVEEDSRQTLNGKPPNFGWDGFIRTNFTMSDEAKAKISRANKGKKRTPEFGEAVRARNLGRKASDETRAKMSAVRKGIPKPEGFGAKISAARKGKAMEQSTKYKLRQSALGRTHTIESRKKMSASQQGIPKNTTHYQCQGCDLVTNSGCITSHQKSSGHQGRVKING